MKYIDLHTHTRFSDAEVTLEHSLAAADKLGLSLFSVTDHNTVSSYAKLSEHRHFFKGKILPGVELSTVFHGEVIEILGYGIDTEIMNELISLHYPTFYEKQVKEARLDTLAMLRIGVTLDEEFVKSMTESPESVFDPSRDTNRPYLLREIKRHPENARFFASDEEFRNINEQKFTRDYLFNAKSQLFSDQSSLCPDIFTVIDMIRKCGGLAFLAHPFVYSENIIRKLDEIAGFGLDGMECHYGTFTPEQKQFMVDYCDRSNIFKCGGSDYHGLVMRPNNILGLSAGESILFDLIEPWFEKIEKSLI